MSIFQLLKSTINFVGETHVIDITNDTYEEFHLGSTLKCASHTSWPKPDQKHKRMGSGEDNRNGSISLKDNTYRKISLKLDLNIFSF